MEKVVVVFYHDLEAGDKYPVGVFDSIHDAEVEIYERFKNNPEKRARFEFDTVPFDALDDIDEEKII
jgi:hypothetical protein